MPRIVWRRGRPTFRRARRARRHGPGARRRCGRRPRRGRRDRPLGRHPGRRLAVDLEHPRDDLLGGQAVRGARVPRRRGRGPGRPGPASHLGLAELRTVRQGAHDDAAPALSSSRTPGVSRARTRGRVRRPHDARRPPGRCCPRPCAGCRRRRTRTDLRPPARRSAAPSHGRTAGRAVRPTRKRRRVGPAPARRGARPGASGHPGRPHGKLAARLSRGPTMGPRPGPTARTARAGGAELRSLPAYGVPSRGPARHSSLPGELLRRRDPTRGPCR